MNSPIADIVLIAAKSGGIFFAIFIVSYVTCRCAICSAEFGELTKWQERLSQVKGVLRPKNIDATAASQYYCVRPEIENREEESLGNLLRAKEQMRYAATRIDNLKRTLPACVLGLGLAVLFGVVVVSPQFSGGKALEPNYSIVTLTVAGLFTVFIGLPHGESYRGMSNMRRDSEEFIKELSNPPAPATQGTISSS
ncbi:hypothetical protein [Oleiharenicola sp. Vm1]|uniref:hypothetical protein n=1 Tax=Oleiharenicola sp. Vm1 TaxID=3398393 RepID=UPI0039F4CF9D